MGTPKETKTLDATQLAEWAARLRIVATRIESASDVLKEAERSVDVANWKSGELGVKNLLSFTTAIHQSIDEMLMQFPIAKKSKPPKKSG